MSDKKRHYKYCIVPKCGNTTTKTPDKLFISLPANLELRDLWQKAMKRENLLSIKGSKYCCEDHFNLEEDLENYLYIKTMKSGKIKLKPGVIPHIFDCQEKMSDKKPKQEELIFKEKNKQLVANLLRTQIDILENPQTNNYIFINPIIKQEYEVKPVQFDNPITRVAVSEFPKDRMIIKQEHENKASQVSIDTKMLNTDMLELSQYSSVIKKEYGDKSVQVNIKTKVRSKAIQCDILVQKRKRRKRESNII